MNWTVRTIQCPARRGREKDGGGHAEVLGEGRRVGPVLTKLGWKWPLGELCEAD